MNCDCECRHGSQCGISHEAVLHSPVLAKPNDIGRMIGGSGLPRREAARDTLVGAGLRPIRCSTAFLCPLAASLPYSLVVLQFPICDPSCPVWRCSSRAGSHPASAVTSSACRAAVTRFKCSIPIRVELRRQLLDRFPERKASLRRRELHGSVIRLTAVRSR